MLGPTRLKRIFPSQADSYLGDTRLMDIVPRPHANMKNTIGKTKLIQTMYTDLLQPSSIFNVFKGRQTLETLVLSRIFTK